MTLLELRQRRHQLLVALAVLQLGRLAPGGAELRAALHAWQGSWTGVGHVVTGLARQGFDVQLIGYSMEGRWHATVFGAGREHSIIAGTAWEATPWGAGQRAALTALRRTEGGERP